MQKARHPQKTPSHTFLRRTSQIALKFGMHKSEVLTQLSTRDTPPRTSTRSRDITTGSDLGRPPYEFVGEAGDKSYSTWN